MPTKLDEVSTDLSLSTAYGLEFLAKLFSKSFLI